jgi:hypothetical protein
VCIALADNISGLCAGMRKWLPFAPPVWLLASYILGCERLALLVFCRRIAQPQEKNAVDPCPRHPRKGLIKWQGWESEEGYGSKI